MIYTFYSYKGGVGRSMALANTAAWFYEQGLRVVIIDWDLEAPGLESFFVGRDELERVRAKPGLIDLLLAYKDEYPHLPLPVSSSAATSANVEINPTQTQVASFMAASAALVEGANLEADPSSTPLNFPAVSLQSDDANDATTTTTTSDIVKILDEHLPPLSFSLYPLRPPKTSDEASKQALWLLTAGWRSEDHFAEYGRAVQTFGWSDFYQNFHGEAYFEWMRKQLSDDKLADVVLIDSRTGLTEMGGVCTRQLADTVVAFVAPNVQNLNGVVKMIASFKKEEVKTARGLLDDEAGGRPLEIVVVPTRIEVGENDELIKFKAEFCDKLTEFPAAFRRLNATFWDLMIQYIPKYAYAERLCIGDPNRSEILEKAYKNLAAHLALLAPDGSPLRERFKDELQRVFASMRPRVFLIDMTQGGDDRAYLEHVRTRLEGEGISLWQDYGDGKGDEDEDDREQKIKQNVTHADAQINSIVDLVEFAVIAVTPASLDTERLRNVWRYARRQGVDVRLVNGNPDVRRAAYEMPRWLGDAMIYNLESQSQWDLLIKILKSPSQFQRVPFMSPELPDSFTARSEELEALTRTLLNEENEPHAVSRTLDSRNLESSKHFNVALCGRPGSGKSTLARAVCHDERIITAFSDGILWANLGETPNIIAELSKLYFALTGESRTFAGEEVAADALAEKLGDKNCLIVIDNVWNDAALQFFMRAGNRCTRLLTTRDAGLAARYNVTKFIVGEMSDDEAARLIALQANVPLNQNSKGEQGEHDARNGRYEAFVELANQLGKIPLALKLAGAALRRRLELNEDFDSAFTYLLDAVRERGVLAFDDVSAAANDTSVTTSIEASLADLSADERERYAKLATLPTSTDIALADVVALWNTNEFSALQLVERLHNLSLLKYDYATKTISLHVLLRSFLIAQKNVAAPVESKAEAAEKAFVQLTPGARTTAQRVLTRLVSVAPAGDKTGDTAHRIEVTTFDAAAQATLKTFSDAGIVKLEEDSTTHKKFAALTDEILIRDWTRLATWLEADREFLIWRQSLAAPIAEWENSNRYNTGALLSGEKLKQAFLWTISRKDDFNQTENLFISDSQRIAQAQRAKQLQSSGTRGFVVVIVLVALGFGLYNFIKVRRISDDEVANIFSTDNKAAPLMLQQEAELNSIRAIEMVRNGEENLRSGDLAAAMRSFNQATEIDAANDEAYFYLGQTYAAQGDTDKALANYDKAADIIAANPQKTPEVNERYSKIYNARGEIFLNQNRNPEAMENFNRALELRSEYPEALYNRALARRDNGETEAAIADFQAVFGLATDVTLRVAARDNLKQLAAASAVNNPPEVATPTQPKIYLHYNDTRDAPVLYALTTDLSNVGYKVSGKELRGERTSGDVRYFNEADKGTASDILKIVEMRLAKQNYTRPIALKSLGKSYPYIPRGVFEVWLPSLQTSPRAASSVTKPAAQ
ncbi:MAG: NB-ARC domain-containing protein [Pyrinomonadaceae bacterium MAG19_C2-C3]|nr:NB-ARC domain-containing protein [Pyrinomonadaceae bacterium MAG19_C2-C3]